MSQTKRPVIDIKRHARRMDSLARAIDLPSGPGRIRIIRQRFAELSDGFCKEINRKTKTPEQLRLF